MLCSGSKITNKVPIVLNVQMFSSFLRLVFCVHNELLPFYAICANSFNLIRQLISFFLGCNETLTTVNGTFQSPNFPRKYPDGQYCSWRITVNTTQQIHLMFTNFSLQNEKDTDELYVYDGENATGEVLGVFYGGHPPSKKGIFSSSNRMFLIFKSDKTVSYSGFSASYYVVYKSGMF